MTKGWSTELKIGLLVGICIFWFTGFLFAEEVRPASAEVSQEINVQALDQEICPQSLLPKIGVKKIFEVMKLDELLEVINIGANVKKLEREQLLNFAKVSQEAFMDLTCPENFKQITNDPERLARRLGFDSVDQIVKAQPGPALAIKRVDLNEISDFGTSENPDDLMPFARQIIIPLIDPLTEVARSSLTFTFFEKSNEWRWTRRGASNRIQTIQKFRNDTRELVVIPGLNLSFLALRSQGPLSLIPLYDTTFENLQIKAGQALPATTIFSKLKPEARKILSLGKNVPAGKRKPVR